MSDKVVFGEVDWNAGDTFGGGDKKKTPFMKIEQGMHTVRVMGNPIQFYTHWLELSNGDKKKINSPIGDPELVRKLEDAGFKRKPRWLIKVLDRSDNEFKLLEIGSQIYNGIKQLYTNPKWGKVTAYDVDIERGKPGTQPLYRVTPNPKEALPAEFKEKFNAFNDEVNIERLIAPADPKEVMKFMGWSSDSDPFNSSSEESDDDYNFEFK